MADFDPTAANIIASLGIKGATVGKTTGTQFEGYVPVLDANGKLSAELISMDTANLSIPALSNVAFVDPTTEAEHRKGSIVSPFKSLTEAATNFRPTDGYIAFVLAPGKYTDSIVDFANSPHKVYLIGLGECEFTARTISIGGIATSPESKIHLQGIRISGTLTSSTGVDLHVVGGSYVQETKGFDGYKLSLSSDSVIGEDDVTHLPLTDASVVYLSKDSRIANTSVVNDGEGTVKEALDIVGSRHIKYKRIASSASELRVEDVYETVVPDSSNNYDLSEHDKIFVNGINRLFALNSNRSSTWDTITADIANITKLNIKYLSIGGVKLTVDNYGYLVVMDESAEETTPPDNVVTLIDGKDGTTYTLGVTGGRLYVAEADLGDGTTPQDSITVYEGNSAYSLSIYNKRLGITKI